MSDGIQFGDLEHTQPQRALRPDENRQFVVAPVGRFQETDLPIFIDLDVHAEMDGHATSDTSVELGGVLLGRACCDERGQPFVVVSDCIRAEHYESTKGSFKFTHETWAAISRERERAAPDLQIVGWYHTHPGWGVFLSGMDLFICENFFNKPLDIAYVIDPCRHDRGMFQWTDAASPDDNRSVQPTAGYYLFTSRFRTSDLHAYLAELNTIPARQPQSSGIHGGRLHDLPPWRTLAILGMFTAQLLLIASSDAASPSTWWWPGGFALAIAAMLALASRFAARAQAPNNPLAT
jgi:proteasome lid subunit RPN8/RPN11